MEQRGRLDSESSATPGERASGGGPEVSPSSELLLVGFAYTERQRLRFLRQLYERGKLTEFAQNTRD